MNGQNKRIIMYKTFICYINEDLLNAFYAQRITTNFSEWIRKEAKKCYSIELNNKNDILDLKDKVLLEYYDNIGEWIKERMRKAMSQNSNEDTKYIIMRYINENNSLYLYEDTLLSLKCNTPIYNWSSNKLKAKLFDYTEDARKCIEEEISANYKCMVVNI